MACPADACVAESMPTISGGSNLDCVDMVVLPGGGAATSGAAAVAADAGADADEALAAEAPAAASDNESVDDDADDVPAPKFRKLICSEPPPAVRVRCCGGFGRFDRTILRSRSWCAMLQPALP